MTEQTDGPDKSDPYFTPTLILPHQGGGDVEVQSSLYNGEEIQHLFRFDYGIYFL